MNAQSNSCPLDWMTILEASQDLLRELVLETLVAKMMRVVIEQTGTQNAYLILNNNGQWAVEASGTITEKGEVETHLFQGVQETLRDSSGFNVTLREDLGGEAEVEHSTELRQAQLPRLRRSLVETQPNVVS
ncbi:MAG TPA: hypothetical protein V6C95_11120, partial [Coleofasciculaceae cyanobacterium]